MPTYSEMFGMVARDPASIHQLRLEYLEKLNRHTGRPVVAYFSNENANPRLNMVEDDDITGLMDVLKGIKGKEVDVLLHSLGGLPDAADMVNSYLREKFDHVRVIVPRQALSAATMIACCADQLVLARHSYLGPIDLQVPVGGQMVAAQDVLDQFRLIKEDFRSRPKTFWMGPGKLYFPTTLVACQNALLYGQEVAERYLRDHMFRDRNDPAGEARRVAADLADHQKHKSHGRRLSRKYLRSIGLTVVDLEEDQEFQDLVLTIHHCFMHTFNFFPHFAKLVQNHNGRIVPSIDFNKLPDMPIPSEEEEDPVSGGEE